MDENNIKYQRMIEDTDKRLKNLMAKWVLRYDYFGFLFSLVRRRAVVGLRNPMAVCATKSGRIELLYNPIIISATGDVDLVTMPSGNGSNIAQIPDLGVTGGNCRGDFSTDFAL